MLNHALSKKYLMILSTLSVALCALWRLLTYFLNVSFLQTVVYILLGITASVIIMYLGRNRKMEPASLQQKLLIAFLIWQFISCIVMTMTGTVDWMNYNTPFLLESAALFLLAFPLGYLVAKEKSIPGVVKAVPHVFLLGWTLFMLFVLFNVLQGREVPTLTGGVIRLNDGSLELNCNRNTTGMWQIVFFLGCFTMLLRPGKRAWKLIYVIATVIQYVALVLSNSRAAYYSVVIGLAAAAFIFSLKIFEKKKTTVKIVLASLCAAGAVVLLLLSRKYVYQVLQSSAARTLTDSNPDTLDGRTILWKYSIQGMFSSFKRCIFGVTCPGVPNLMSEMSAGTHQTYTHNQFLEIGVSTGIIGLGIFVAWFVLVLKNVYKQIVIQKDRSWTICIPMMILVLMLANQFEAVLLYYHHINSFVFFLFCGVLQALANNGETRAAK